MTDWREQLAGIFSRNAERTFVRDAILGRTFKYGEVLRLAASGAQSLRALGAVPGDRVGLDFPNGTEFAVLYLSCLFGGYTAVPLNAALPLKDRQFILEKSRLKALLRGVDTKPLPGDKADLAIEVPQIGSDAADFRWSHEHGIEAGELRRLHEDAAWSMTFTSGTTSLPKAVVHGAASLLRNAASFDEKFKLHGARWLHVMPMAYMAGFLNTLLCPLMGEGEVVLAPQFGAATALRFWEPVMRHEPDAAWMAPTMLATLLKLDRDPRGREYCRRSRLRILSATAPLPYKVRRDFEAQYGVPVIESYGLSELLLITANDGPEGSKDFSVGVALPEASCEARAADGKPLAAGASGEIFVRTPFRMQGYMDYESGRSVPPASEWMATGDIGHVDEHGYVFITGRSKDLVIRGGYNISPRSLEELFIRHPAIDDVAVFGVPHDFLGEELVAAVILKSGFALDAVRAELLDWCRCDLGQGMLPDRIIARDAFPVSTTGKVQKHQLRQLLSAGGSA